MPEVNKLLTQTKDMPELDITNTAILINRSIGESELSSLYLTEYAKTNQIPDIQFYSNDDLLGEIGVQDVADFIRIPNTTSLDINKAMLTTGEVFGPAIPSASLTAGDVWSLKKDTATVKFWISFKIIAYKANTNLKIQYKVLEFKYK